MADAGEKDRTGCPSCEELMELANGFGFYCYRVHEVIDRDPETMMVKVRLVGAVGLELGLRWRDPFETFVMPPDESGDCEATCEEQKDFAKVEEDRVFGRLLPKKGGSGHVFVHRRVHEDDRRIPAEFRQPVCQDKWPKGLGG